MRVIIDRARTVNLDEFLGRPLFAHLSTASADGPRDSPLWFLWEEKAVWMIAEDETNTFHQRLRDEPRCAIGIVDFDGRNGKVQHVGIRGKAEVVEFDAERARRLYRKYLGPNEDRWAKRFRSGLENSKGFSLVKVVPRTVVARDVSYAVPDGS